MIINIGDDILKLRSLKLLNKVLIDKTTKKNILWATDAYKDCGPLYRRDREITQQLITGHNADVIKTRARKAMEQQSERTKQHAEVFTPLWIVQKMNDHADEVWFGYPNALFKDGNPTETVNFPEGTPWQEYVDFRRLEITCGEAPYLVTRYDVETGEAIPIKQRVGILDRKLRVVTENALSESEWLKWAYRAMEATYGYEFQGDNVLIARVNLLMTFEEHLRSRWDRKPTASEYFRAANIIAWNIWQMDGLAGTIPYCKAEESKQLSMFEWLELEERIREAADAQPHCQIYNWRAREPLEYLSLQQGRKERMKFDYIIGNPPYQDETLGDNATYAPPIYHLFLDEAYKIADHVELIHPARFLFNAGSTPKDWNKKMLSDEHLKVLYYEQDSSKVFSNTDIKGGVAITYRDNTENFGAIETFTAFNELNSIMRKVNTPSDCNVSNIVYIQNRFNLEALFADYPSSISGIGSDGRDSRFEKNIFKKVSEVFSNEQTDSSIKVLGIIDNKRVWRYIDQKYVDKSHENLYKYKVLVPTSNGSGAIGEVLSTPLIGSPLIGYTRSFIGIGAFETKDEGEAALKYIKSKFARTMLGILKITQDNNKPTWRYVPLQDFTTNSDIDWSQSVADIDRQLYAKYGLNENEINFIETHVKEMK